MRETYIEGECSLIICIIIATCYKIMLKLFSAEHHIHIFN